MPESDLVKTGIKGLDEILFGGIPRGNIILLAGTAGTGKTTLGVEFVYRGARQFNEPGVIVLFEVAPDKLIRDAALFGWDLRALERDGRLRMVFTTRQLFQQELQQADSPLLAVAAEIGARRIFVDGLVRLPESNGGNARRVPCPRRGAAPREPDGHARAGVDVGRPRGGPSARGVRCRHDPPAQHRAGPARRAPVSRG